MKLDNIKNLFLRVMLGCLIAAAALAVVTILLGSFNDLAAKALWTIMLVALHCLVSFGFIVNNEKQETFENLEFFTNVTFILIIMSFITSVLGVWQLLGGDFVAKLYALYFVLLFATLHAEILAKMRRKQPSIDNVITFNYFFMGIVVLMLVPVIFVDNSTEVLGEFYFRVLGAVGITDATLTLTAIILHKLYLRKHPTINDSVFNAPQTPLIQPSGQSAPGGGPAPAAQPPQRGMNLFVKILIGYVALQLIGSVLFLGIGLLFSLGN